VQTGEGGPLHPQKCAPRASVVLVSCVQASQCLTPTSSGDRAAPCAIYQQYGSCLDKNQLSAMLVGRLLPQFAPPITRNLLDVHCALCAIPACRGKAEDEVNHMARFTLHAVYCCMTKPVCHHEASDLQQNYISLLGDPVSRLGSNEPPSHAIRRRKRLQAHKDTQLH
jgi:hypothetical protein